MIETNKFNPNLDLGTVIVGLNVDLNNMIETHSIPATACDVVYNDIENIDEVGERIDDTFDGIMIARQFEQSLPSPNSGTGASQGVAPNATTPPTPSSE